MARESSLKRAIHMELDRLDIWYVNYDGSKRGVPDILICYKGRFIGAELKTENGTTTPMQDYNIRRINRGGGLAAVVRSVDELRALLRCHDTRVER